MHEVHGRRSAESTPSPGRTWRHVLTALLLAITLPVFLIAAAVAAVVVAPVAVVYGLVRAARLFQGPAPAARRLLLH